MSAKYKPGQILYFINFIGRVGVARVDSVKMDKDGDVYYFFGDYLTSNREDWVRENVVGLTKEEVINNKANHLREMFNTLPDPENCEQEIPFNGIIYSDIKEAW